MSKARCCCCVPLPVAIYVLAPATFCISILLATMTSWYLAHYHSTISHVSTVLLSIYVAFTLLLSLSSILGLAGAIRHKSKWVKIYAELICMNWFIGLGLGIGHIVKTWKNRKQLLEMCKESMDKAVKEEDAVAAYKATDGCEKAFKWVNAFIIIAFILINIIILYFVIVAFKAAKHMETEVPAVGQGYTYPPDTWNNNTSSGGGGGGGGRMAAAAGYSTTAAGRQRSASNATATTRGGGNGAFHGSTSSSTDEKPGYASSHHQHHRSQSINSGLSVNTSRKQPPTGTTGAATAAGTTYADERYGHAATPTAATREKSNSLSSGSGAGGGLGAADVGSAAQTVPLGVGNGVYVSRYASKGSMEVDAGGAWK